MNPPPTENKSRLPIISLIWTPIVILIGIVLLVVLFFQFKGQVNAAPLSDFDAMVVSDGFHQIKLPNGQRFELSYEQNHDRLFDGIVRHTNMDHESNFPILSFDILVTSGDFADSGLVSTSVTDHHFTWRATGTTSPQGTINLLHTVPMNQAIEEQLKTIKVGDHVIVKGWDILKIDGFNREGNYIGYWQDSGCNTTLITEIVVEPQSD